MTVGVERSPDPGRWAVAEIDLDAIEHNVRLVAATVAPSDVWAVVKADGYGHGAIRVAEAARRAGAAGLCVALVDEGVELRDAGIDAPILVFGEQPPAQLAELVGRSLTPTVCTPAYVAALAEHATADAPLPVHLNVDTGMQRVGVRSAGLDDLVAMLHRHRTHIRVAGVYTHLACADEPGHPANAAQLASFEVALARLGDAGVDVDLVHAANSAAALVLPEARRSFVRAGIAIYGVSPGPALDGLAQSLRPAMRVSARVTQVERVAAGTHVSYGWRHRFEAATTVATVPIGYADGVPRRLGTLPDRRGADVLVGGRRRPIVGVVTMDQFMVDVGDDPVRVGDEVVLLGEQGDERIRPEQWADRLGTIGYEIVCGIGARVPRIERRGPLAP